MYFKAYSNNHLHIFSNFYLIVIKETVIGVIKKNIHKNKKYFLY